MKATKQNKDKKVKFVNFNVSDLLNAASSEANERACKLLHMAQAIVERRRVYDDGDSGKEIVQLTMYALNEALQNPYTKDGSVKTVAVVWLKKCPDDALLTYHLNRIIGNKRTDYQRGELKRGSRFRKKPLTEWEKTERRLSADGENADGSHRIRPLDDGEIDRIADSFQSHVRDTLDAVLAKETFDLIMENGATSPELEEMLAGYAVLALRKEKPDGRHDPDKPNRDGFTRPLVKLMGVPASIIKNQKVILQRQLLGVKIEMLE